jgi:hypothetical protein
MKPIKPTQRRNKMKKEKAIAIGKFVVRIAASICVAKVVSNAVRLAMPTTSTRIETIVAEIGGALITSAFTDAVVNNLMEAVDETLAPIVETQVQEPKPLEA